MADDVLREIDEELRQERYKRLAKTYGPPLAALAVAVIVAVGGWIFWQDYQRASAEAETESLNRAASAIESGEVDGMISQMEELATEAGGARAALAKFQLAGALAQQGERARAESIYGEIVEAGNVGPSLTDYARLMWGFHGLGRADRATIEERLAPLLDADNPWRHSAREVVGHARLEAGATDAAGEAFAAVADSQDAPPQLRQRVTPLAQRYGS